MAVSQEDYNLKGGEVLCVFEERELNQVEDRSMYAFYDLFVVKLSEE